MASVSFNDWVLFMGGAKSEMSSDRSSRADPNNRLTSTFVSLSGKGTKYFSFFYVFTGLKMSTFRQVE